MLNADERTTRPIAFMVDRTMYGEFVHLLDTPDALDRFVRPDLRYHFCGTTGAEYWDALCHTPDYGHEHLVRLVDSWFPDALRAALPRGAPADRVVRLVSLGPGNGEIDVRLLAHLERVTERVAYSCVDSSFELLRRAVSRIANASELHTAFSIDALCADFTSAETPDRSCRTTDVLALLGGTLGNYPEPRLIEGLRRWMSDDGHLLVDAWLWNPNGWNGGCDLSPDEQRSLTATLTFPARNRFVFGPVETATTATAADVRFAHEVNRSVTEVPGAVNIITYCSDLHTRMRLTGQPIDRAHVPLAATTRYEFDQLATWFSTVGLEVRWKKNLGPLGVFLLRREE
jgi:hypothetical protein